MLKILNVMKASILEISKASMLMNTLFGIFVCLFYIYETAWYNVPVSMNASFLLVSILHFTDHP